MVVVAANKPAPGGTAQQPHSGNEEKKWPALEEGIYVAEVARAQYRGRDTEQNWPAFKTHDSEINWGFRVTSGEYKNRWLFFDTPLTLESGSALRQTIKELTLQDDLPEGYTLDTDDLSDWEGLDCRVRVEQYYSKKHKEFRNAVREVLRPTDAMYEQNPF